MHLFLSVRVMNGAMMFKQTQTSFDVLANWPGVEGGGWLSKLASYEGATFHRHPEKWPI